MATLALPGVYSGIDSEVLIEHTLAAASRPLQQLHSRRSDWQARASAVSEIEGRLGDLKALLADMRRVSDLRSVLGASTDTDVAVARAADGAGEGVYQVEVNRIAAAEREIHDGIASVETYQSGRGVDDGSSEYLSAEEIDVAGGRYRFVFQFGDEAQVSVDLSAYDATGITLDQLVGEINTAAGYTAALSVSDGGSMKLRFRAQNPGDGKDLTITDDSSVELLNQMEDVVRVADGGVGTDALVGAGEFIYTYNGVTRTIVTDASTSLGELRDLINNDSGNPGVTAGIIDYEIDPDHRFHLSLNGNDSGGDYAIVVEAGTTVAAFAPATFAETQTATDSQIRVDGYPTTGWIEQSGNSISDVIPNVTIELRSTGTTTLTMSRSTSRLKEDLRNLVSIYNGIAMKLDEYTGYDAETDTSGVLQGDSVINSILSRVRSALVGRGKGFTEAADSFSMLADIGITVDREGEMSLDEAVLDEAIAEDYLGVLSLIGAAGTGSTDSDDLQINSVDTYTTAGAYELEVDYAADGSIAAARFRLDGQSEWNDATVAGNTISGVVGKPEQGLSLTVVSGGVSETCSYTVNVRQGVAGTVYDVVDDVLDPLDGTIAMKRAGIDSAVDRINARIETQQDRLERKEEMLRERYARLEAMLAQLDAQRAAVESMMQSLSSSGQSSGSNSNT